MANLAIAGFQPARRSGGGTITYRRARVLTNNTLPINLFDAVVIDTNGNVLQASTTTTAVASVQAGGASYVDATGVRTGAKGLPAATLYTSSGVAPENASYVFLVDNVLEVDFLASITTALVLTDMNNTTSFVAGTGTNLISAQTLDSAGVNTTATLPFRIQEFVIASDNDPDAASAHVFCKVNAGQWEPALEISGSLGA